MILPRQSRPVERREWTHCVQPRGSTIGLCNGAAVTIVEAAARGLETLRPRELGWFEGPCPYVFRETRIGV